ncbi:MAG: S24 family peptidase [Bacteroidetes bacterium]|nr:S24 family peptidase [Bacteroidota bacterium]
MDIGSFLSAFKSKIKSLTGKAISSERLAELMDINAEKLRGWEKGSLPRKEDDRSKLKLFFHLKNLDNIPKDAPATSAKKVVEQLQEKLWIGKAVVSKKEVIALGKKIPMRLDEQEFAEAFPDWKGIPVYNVPVSAGFVKHYQDENTYEPIYHLRDPRFKDCNFAAIITGDSMHSEIRHGDYVVCQEVIDRSFIVYGDIYYVVAKNGLETCKYINAYVLDAKNRIYDEDRILLVPKNENITPSPLRKDMIDRLYKVKGIIRGY